MYIETDICPDPDLNRPDPDLHSPDLDLNRPDPDRPDQTLTAQTQTADPDLDRPDRPDLTCLAARKLQG